MALSCEMHTAYLYDRGGRKRLASLDDLSRVKWERRRDDPSTATVYIGTPGIECQKALGLAEAGRTELVIFRGKHRVWEGPIMRISYRGASVELEARDVMVYVVRTIMKGQYNNRHPNTSTVLARIERILRAELARKEALDPPINVLPYMQFIKATPGQAEDARTTAKTLPYEMTVFEHIDNYAARGGLDYTVVGRRVLFFDVHQKIGQTAMVTADDFIGDPVITQYGMELATYVAHTDGKGNWGDHGGTDPYYGLWEVLHQAYDEDGTDPQKPQDPPTTAELEDQAKRTHIQGSKPPLVVRIPDNTRLNPNGVLTITDLVPGVWIPLSASLPGRTVSQMQKLDSMTVEETAENGEEIKVTLSPAYAQTFVEDEE